MAQVSEFYLPDELYYDKKDHLWARLEGNVVRVGMDQFAACSAGTIAYVKIVPNGKEVKKGRPFGSLEAGKYVGPLKAPVSGTITDRNQAVLDDPKLLNTDHYDQGWFVVITPTNVKEDLTDLAHGSDVQTWLQQDVSDYETKGLLKPDREKCK